ncbi:MAG: carbohydrate ABC transporter permease [Defluviitaleaceae bacterium]|nr:carbohydrate ABC transporter permease [Defluviitaleaceae bacterium]
MGLKRKTTISDVVIYIIMILLLALCLIPLLNTLAISFSDKLSAGAGRVFIWPVNFTINPYKELLKDAAFGKSFLVSIERVLLGGAITVVLLILTAYPISKSPEHFRGKSFYMWFLVVLWLFPPALIPSYVLVTKLHLINTIWSLVLPGALPIFSAIILMNFYKTIPPSLEEAALIDGAGPWSILLKIFVPLSKPSIAVVALWSIVGNWNDYFAGLIYIPNHDNWPLMTYIYSLSVSVDYQSLANMSGKEIAQMMSVSNLTFNSAKVFIALIPLLCVYPFLQRYFVGGIVMGAVKE